MREKGQQSKLEMKGVRRCRDTQVGAGRTSPPRSAPQSPTHTVQPFQAGDEVTETWGV